MMFPNKPLLFLEFSRYKIFQNLALGFRQKKLLKFSLNHERVLLVKSMCQIVIDCDLTYKQKNQTDFNHKEQIILRKTSISNLVLNVQSCVKIFSVLH